MFVQEKARRGFERVQQVPISGPRVIKLSISIWVLDKTGIYDGRCEHYDGRCEPYEWCDASIALLVGALGLLTDIM